MKNLIICGVFALANILTSQILQAQGTMTYLSNLDQASAGSLAVGSDSWLAAEFYTGINSSGGYTLDSIQLGMADASGSPSNFMVMLYSAFIGGAIIPGTNLDTLTGSLNPTTAGIYTFTTASNLMLSPNKLYYIVLTAGTAVANGAYEWSYVGANSYNPNGSWSGGSGVATSSDGYTWHGGQPGNFQFAINATAIPEPGVLGLFGLGGLAFLWHRRKQKI